VNPGSPKNELAMFGKNVAKTKRKVVLKVLQFAIRRGVVFIRFGGFAGIQFDKLVGDVGDGEALALLVTPAPEGLQGRAVSSAFGDFQGDDFGVENVGHNLTPDFGFSAAAGGANLGRLDAEFGEPAEAVVHAESDAFHGSAGEMAVFECFFVHAEPDAGAVRHVWSALAFEVGEQEEAVRAGGNAGGFGGEFFVRPAEIVADHFGGDGDVHGAEQGKPVVGGITKRGNFAFGIDDRVVGAGVNGSARSKACGDNAGPSVAGADCAHHVVAAACADEDAGKQVEHFGG